MAAETQPLRCTLKAPARVPLGEPVLLEFSLHNDSNAALQVLTWKTPFEGWFGSYVRVLRDGIELTYQGPSAKRSKPARNAYIAIAAHQSSRAQVDLSLPFELNHIGRYRVEPQLILFDVTTAAPKSLPRSPDQLSSHPLECNPVDIEIISAPASKP